MTKSAQDLLVENEKLAKELLAPGADEIDRERRFPRRNIQELGRSGLLGLVVPLEFGRAGAGIPEMAQVLERMAQACASTAMVTLMHYCGTAVIVAKGSAVLRQTLLPAIARGEHLTTLAFSEAGSGGHFYMPVSEVRRNGHGLRLSAQKTFVTSAGEADSYVVSTRIHPLRKCPTCNMSGRHFGGVFKGSYRPCRACRGSGRRDRVGTKVFWGGTNHTGVFPKK